MTNEELAVKAKAGDGEALLELWKQNDGLVGIFVSRRLARLVSDGNMRGVDSDDLRQAAFLAMVSAIGYFDPEKDIAFTTYWGNRVKHEFNALLGVRTSKRDALNMALSLDAPTDDDPDNGTLGDTIFDPKDAYSEAEERMWQEQLHTAIEKALCRLQPDHRLILHLRFFGGLNREDIAARMGMNESAVRTLEVNAMRELRKPKNRIGLEDYIDLHTNFYAVGSWERQESPVEVSVVRREEMRERYAWRFVREPVTIPAL